MAKVFVLLLCLILAASGFVNCSVVEKENLRIFELKKGELSLKVTNWGASILSLLLPDKNGIIHSSKLQIMIFPSLVSLFVFHHLCSGKLGDVVLGYDSVKDYTVSLLSAVVVDYCDFGLCYFFSSAKLQYSRVQQLGFIQTCDSYEYLGFTKMLRWLRFGV